MSQSSSKARNVIALETASAAITLVGAGVQQEQSTLVLSLSINQDGPNRGGKGFWDEGDTEIFHKKL